MTFEAALNVFIFYFFFFYCGERDVNRGKEEGESEGG